MINNDFNTEEALQGNGEQLDLLEIILPYLRFWPIYLVFTIICLTIAWLYGTTRRTQYPIASTVLFIEGGAQSRSASAMDGINIMELAAGNVSVDINNEIQLMKSRESSGSRYSSQVTT